MSLFSRRKRWYKRRRRLWPVGVLVVLVLLAGAVYVVTRTLDGTANLSDPSEPSEEAKSEDAPAKGSDQGQSTPEEPAPDPEQATPEAAAYVALAPELPGTTPQSIKGVYRSKIDESWASVRVQPENEKKPFVVFTHRDGQSWRAEKSVRADEPKEEKLDLEDLPDAGSADFSSTETVMDDVPESDRERVQKVLEGARQEIEDYDGVAGLYVWDLDNDSGHGVRADEQFFAASTIKIPIMVAVYRKVDQGELEFSQQIEIQEEDWAAGAGWLQWEKAGTKQTVGDLLLLMMTQSDNVASNALVRTVGGPDRINEVARSMGADDTLVYQKISSERGAVPSLDNRSTPRDMVAMMRQVAQGKAASEKSCGYMIDLMHEDRLDWWLDAGLPRGVDAANKAGWLYKVYDEVGIVDDGDGHRYVIAILTKHGSADV